MASESVGEILPYTGTRKFVGRTMIVVRTYHVHIVGARF